MRKPLENPAIVIPASPTVPQPPCEPAPLDDSGTRFVRSASQKQPTPPRREIVPPFPSPATLNTPPTTCRPQPLKPEPPATASAKARRMFTPPPRAATHGNTFDEQTPLMDEFVTSTTLDALASISMDSTATRMSALLGGVAPKTPLIHRAAVELFDDAANNGKPSVAKYLRTAIPHVLRSCGALRATAPAATPTQAHRRKQHAIDASRDVEAYIHAYVAAVDELQVNRQACYVRTLNNLDTMADKAKREKRAHRRPSPQLGHDPASNPGDSVYDPLVSVYNHSSVAVEGSWTNTTVPAASVLVRSESPRHADSQPLPRCVESKELFISRMATFF